MNKERLDSGAIVALLILSTLFVVALLANAIGSEAQTLPDDFSGYLPIINNDAEYSATPTPAPSPTPGASPTPITGILIADHTVIDDFDNIPDHYIEEASNFTLLFRHASVGDNISLGLDCLMNNFDERPPGCDRGLDPGEIYYDPKYDRRNWTFEFHNEYSEFTDPGVGWWNKVYLFEDRVNGDIGPGQSYGVAGFKFGYVDTTDGTNYDIDDVFFDDNPNDNLPSIENLEQLESAHPQTTFMYWTMAISRQSDRASERFNEQMREYAVAHDKVVLDIADIESHRPDGSTCYDVNGNGIIALCDEYAAQPLAGHLNALGMQRMAKAVWWLMARLAGWDGVSN